jgi:HSP20 family protein
MTLMRRAADRRPMPMRDPFRDVMEAWFGGLPDPVEPWTGTNWPAIDLRETGDSYIVEAELAGIRPEDTEVMLDGRTLTIRGEFGEDRQEPMQAGSTGGTGGTGETKGSQQGSQQGSRSGSMGGRSTSQNRYLVRERRRGTFVRAITLPSPVDADHVTSQFENGELMITLPKMQQGRARQIEIQGVSHNGGQGGQQMSGQSGQQMSGQGGQQMSGQSGATGGQDKAGGQDKGSRQPQA